MRILIVDDDKVSGEILLKLLSEYGACDIAVDGIEAIDAFILAIDENKPYDLVCLDLMLPLLDGENVLSVMRKIEKEKKTDASRRVRIVITSALNDREFTAKLSQYGFDRYFVKPIDAGAVTEYMESF